MFGQVLSNFRLNSPAAIVDIANRLHQFLPERAFEKVTVGAGLKSTGRLHIAGIGR